MEGPATALVRPAPAASFPLRSRVGKATAGKALAALAALAAAFCASAKDAPANAPAGERPVIGTRGKSANLEAQLP